MKKIILIVVLVLVLISCVPLTERQKDALTVVAIVGVGFVLANHDGSGNVMCDDNPHTLQTPCAN